MALTYGFIKCKVVSDPTLKASRHKRELQYHLHQALEIAGQDGASERWDSAINVGTSDADDLLRYKLVFDFRHPSLAGQRRNGWKRSGGTRCIAIAFAS